MPNKNTFLLLFVVVLLFSGCTSMQKSDLVQTSEINSPNAQTPEIKASDTETLSDIEQELKIALNSGGLNPKRAAEIKELLIKFENTSEKQRLESISIVLQDIEGENKEPPLVMQNETPDQDSIYEGLQNQIKIIESLKGEISPEIHNEFLTKLNDLYTNGYDPDKVHLLNESFRKALGIDCISNPNPVFLHHIVEPDYVINILPPPNIAKAYGDLKTHSYVNTESLFFPVYAPTNMSLIDGAYYIGGPYGMTFEVSCEVTIRFGHLTEPVQKIKDVLNKEPRKDTKDTEKVYPSIFFKEGELIGYSGGPPHVLAYGFDFGVYNKAKPNRYASSNDPEILQSKFYTTADCPYDYFTPQINAEYRSKFYLTKAEGMIADGPSFCK